jgi:hypothetical protein
MQNQVLLSSGTIGMPSIFGSLPLNNSNSVTGILPINNGGTGKNSFSINNTLIKTSSDGNSLESTDINPNDIVTNTGIVTLTNKSLQDNLTYFVNNLDTTKKMQFLLSGISIGTTRTLTIPNENGTITLNSGTQTLTNKSIDADQNTLINIANDNIKSTAMIEVTKLADGTISNTEFQYLGGLTGNIQTQINNHTTSTSTVHGTTSAIVGISDTQILTNKTINANNNTITGLTDTNILSLAGISATKIADGSVNNTEFQYLNGLSDNVQTQINTHLSDTSNPHSVTPSQIGNDTAQWNANKINDIDVISNSPEDGQILVYNSESNNYQLGQAFDNKNLCALFDDFIGSSLINTWISNTNGVDSSVTFIDGIGGILRLTSGSSTNDYSELRSGNKLTNINSTAKLTFRFKLLQTTNTIVRLGFISDNSVPDNNLIDFYYSADSSVSDWFCRTINSEVSSSIATGVTGDTNWHEFEILTSLTEIKFYIDSNLVASSSTNLYTGLLFIYANQTTKLNGNTKSCQIDYIKFISDREDNLTAKASGQTCVLY